MMRAPAVILAASAAVLSYAALAQPVRFEQPLDETPAELAGPEAEPVAIHCSSCHSLDYVTTQPRGKGAQFWRDAVTKMVNVYGAPISPEDADTIAGILAGKFG